MIQTLINRKREAFYYLINYTEEQKGKKTCIF